MKSRTTRWLKHALVMSVCALVVQLGVGRMARAQTAPASAEAKPTKPAEVAAAPAEQPHYLRVSEVKGKSISLQISSRSFARLDGTGPKVALVGVAHIGDQSFYQCVQKLLKNYDVVLYESVKPPGAGGAGGKTDEERIESTKAAMQFIGGIIETHHAKTDKYPADIKSLQEFAAAKDARLASFVNIAMVDAWGRKFDYSIKPAVDGAAEGGAKYKLISLGADGKTGGEGENADLDLADQPIPDPMALSKEDGIQSQLASALGLQFQLDALKYDEPNWRCSDMAMDEVNRRLEAKGLNFGVIGGTLAGSSLPAKVIKVVLGLMKLADTFLEGAIADTFKVVMIEMLGDERLMEMGLDQLGKGFGDVIVGDRNQVAVNDLKKLIETEPQIKSVAILYGAAHMPDMAAKLKADLGYEPVPEFADEWLTAITVDLTQSVVSQQELQQIRMMMKQMMRQQMRAPKN